MRMLKLILLIFVVLMIIGFISYYVGPTTTPSS